MTESLWGEEFDIKDNTKDIINKINNPKKLKSTSTVSGRSKNISLYEKLQIIESNVTRILGKRISSTTTIKTEEDFVKLIDKAIENKIIALDTETNNTLDYINCKLMGLCLYTPDLNPSYIPVNHINLQTKERLNWQITESFISTQLQRLIDNNVKFIYHNAKFDIEVIRSTCNIKLPVYWDTLIGARLLDENEKAGLKEQYILHIDSEQEKYSIEHLFEKEEYAIFKPELFALYAATDAKMTYDLYLYQLNKFTSSSNVKLFKLFRDVEIPCISVIADMEYRGVYVDREYTQRLSDKYHKLLEDMNNEIENEMNRYNELVEQWRLSSDANIKDGNKKSKNEQLDSPINLGSPTQLAIFLYDVLKVPVVDKKKPRGTGKEELIAIKNKTNLRLCELLLEYKQMSKLVDAFLDSLPKQVNEKTGRIHCSYRQIGADTGRQSCSEPNLQQIPSHNKEIRLIFKAQDEFLLSSSDFSQQEPRLLAFYSQDENMIQSYKEGKDLYSMIASKVFHNKYEDNLEHYPDGTINVEGKERRSKCKSLLLGIMYGMGVQSIADLIKGTKEEAQTILNDFFKGFPKVKKWITETEEFALKNGYVEDWYGRRRRISELKLPKYEVRYKDDKLNIQTKFNPFLICEDTVKTLDKTLQSYLDKCEKIKSYSDFDLLRSEAEKKGVIISSNTNKIAEALRKCVNARIQGGASTMTKIAMNKLYNDKILNDLDFHMLISVHDELIGECPKENAEKVTDRLTYIMRTCIEDYCNVPFKCDGTIDSNWYYEEYSSVIKKEYNTLLKDKDSEKAFKELCENHSESLEEDLRKIVLD